MSHNNNCTTVQVLCALSCSHKVCERNKTLGHILQQTKMDIGLYGCHVFSTFHSASRVLLHCQVPLNLLSVAAEVVEQVTIMLVFFL